MDKIIKIAERLKEYGLKYDPSRIFDYESFLNYIKTWTEKKFDAKIYLELDDSNSTVHYTIQSTLKYGNERNNSVTTTPFEKQGKIYIHNTIDYYIIVLSDIISELLNFVECLPGYNLYKDVDGKANNFFTSKKVYISGQITGLSKEEYSKLFGDAKEKLNKEGYIVVDPSVRGINDVPVAYADILISDFLILKSCTAIYLLPNYKNSKGAMAELAFAKALGLEIIFGNEEES